MLNRLILTVFFVLAVGCQVSEENIKPDQTDEPMLVDASFNPAACDFIDDEPCIANWRALQESFSECRARCDICSEGPPVLANCFDIQDASTRTQCERTNSQSLQRWEERCAGSCGCFDPGPLKQACPQLPVYWECSDCAADPVKVGVKYCKIPNAFPSIFVEPFFYRPFLCNDSFTNSFECSECRLYSPPVVGRVNCTCPTDSQKSVSNLCTIPMPVEGLLTD